MSCAGHSHLAGLTEVHPGEAEAKRQLLGLARRRVGLLDGSKLGRVTSHAFAASGELQHLIPPAAHHGLSPVTPVPANEGGCPDLSRPSGLSRADGDA